MSLISIWNWILSHISILLSAMALILSVWVWLKQGRYEGKLAKFKLDQFNRINIFPKLIMDDRSETPKLRFENIGDIDAYNVQLEYENDVPINISDYRDKFPIPKFSPNIPISLLFPITLASPSSFKITIKWENEKGEKFHDNKTVYMY